MTAFLLILIAVGGAFLFLRANTRRGSRFVKAQVFLDSLEMGSSVEEANAAASMFGGKYSSAESDAHDIARAKAVAAVKFGGRQLPVIEKWHGVKDLRDR